MFGDTGPGGGPKVQTDVEPVWPKGALQDALTEGSELENLTPLLWSQLRE
jgi:hypothetical protein